MAISMRCISKSQLILPYYEVRMLAGNKMCTVVSKPKMKKAMPNISSTPAELVSCDWIGPPDKISNIRKIKFYIPPDETLLEREYREQREAVQEWHHRFWTNHNKNFFIQKAEFIKQKRLVKNLPNADKEESDESLSPDELSQFYRSFLDSNYSTHKQYNKDWYRKNLLLLWPAFKVNLARWFTRQTSKQDTARHT